MMKEIRTKKPFPWGRILIHSILIIGSIVMFYPLLFGILGSFVNLETYYDTVWLPDATSGTLENYMNFITAAEKAPLWIFNTVLRIVWYIVVPGTVAVLCGYVFGKLKFKGKGFAFSLLLSSMMVPGIVHSLPLYVMLSRWPLAGGNNILGQGGHGFVNEWPALIIAGLVNVYYIFLMRQTFQTIPDDFEEAARVDGASTVQILWFIYLPIVRPALVVMIIFQSVGIWNDYVWPLIAVGGNQDAWTIALGFQRIMEMPPGLVVGTGEGAVHHPWSFTVAVIATMPIIALYMYFQRYFVEGVSGFAIKG